jgi:hypothetical protein
MASGRGGAAGASYERGRPEQSVLYQVLQNHLATFLQTATAHDDTTSVPKFVEKELRGLLDCGVLARGLIRLHCDDCKRDHVVGLSCKGRGFCPRCGGRRMTERAAHLVDHVFPHVPVRQWVLTLPHRFRYRIGYDHALCKRFLRVLDRALQAYYRHKTGRRDGQSGSVTFIQRFNSSLALSPHFHLIALDGVFVDEAAHGLRFVEAAEPSKLDVAEIVSTVHARIHAAMERLELEGRDGEDPLASDSPALAACYAGAVMRRTALGPDAGKAIGKLGAEREAPWIDHDKPRHSHYEGFDLHADVALRAHDRQGLEKLLRYGARSAVAGERLRLAQDGRVVLTLKRRYHDGTSHLVFEPTTFIERLAALVPRPHKNLTIYGGVLAPHAKLRSRVIAFSAGAAPTQASDPVAAADGDAGDAPTQPQLTDKPRRPNYTWAELMRRAFEIDVLACSHCGGRLKLLAAITRSEAIRAILASLGLSTDAPELRPARAPPGHFDWA